VAPDVMPRRITDLELAHRFRDRGLAGFFLKSHYVPTAERAAVVNAAVPGVAALGGIVLNAAVGGINPFAVEIAAREGAVIVSMPTVDALNEPAGRRPIPPDGNVPMWARLQHELRGRGIESAPVPVVDDAGVVLPEVRRVLEVIAAHDLVLATGHLSRDEILAVVDAAVATGVRRIIVTHPEFPSQDLSGEDQASLAAKGALLERCFTTPHTGKVSWEKMFANVRAGGPRHSFFSSDLGQPHGPPVEDGLALLADRFLAAGFSEEEVRTMAVANTAYAATGRRDP